MRGAHERRTYIARKALLDAEASLPCRTLCYPYVKHLSHRGCICQSNCCISSILAGSSRDDVYPVRSQLQRDDQLPSTSSGAHVLAHDAVQPFLDELQAVADNLNLRQREESSFGQRFGEVIAKNGFRDSVLPDGVRVGTSPTDSIERFRVQRHDATCVVQPAELGELDASCLGVLVVHRAEYGGELVIPQRRLDFFNNTIASVGEVSRANRLDHCLVRLTSRGEDLVARPEGELAASDPDTYSARRPRGVPVQACR
jgi:hypothetical protein